MISNILEFSINAPSMSTCWVCLHRPHQGVLGDPWLHEMPFQCSHQAGAANQAPIRLFQKTSIFYRLRSAVQYHFAHRVPGWHGLHEPLQARLKPSAVFFGVFQCLWCLIFLCFPVVLVIFQCMLCKALCCLDCRILHVLSFTPLISARSGLPQVAPSCLGWPRQCFPRRSLRTLGSCKNVNTRVYIKYVFICIYDFSIF